MENEDKRPIPPGAWIRKSVGLEFDRVVFFTDAVFAIALTLLVVSVAVPILHGTKSSPGTMLSALSKLTPDFLGFFIAFILIARYWMAHHVFFGQLRAIDTGLISINMVYLAFVAFLPFPSALVGRYEQNPVSVLLFAVCLAIISSLEAVQFRHAYRRNLLSLDISRDVYKWEMLGALTPVAVFLLTSPIAFVSTTLCLVSWMITIPIGIAMDKRAPEGVADFTLHGTGQEPGK